MNKKFDLLKNAKYIIVAVFAILAALSLWLMGLVGTNYNISDYLDDSTDTKMALGIMNDEFGSVNNIQVMVNDVTPDEAEEIKNKLKTAKNVSFVNFNSQSADYYKNNTALFVVLVNGSEYSNATGDTLAEITDMMEKDYPGQVSIGGAVMEKNLLREAIQNEIMLILIISVCLVSVLLLITAASWIEPLVLLAASGIAVLLNMGSNIIFGEISYITKAIAAILQLALSIDYSIVLLHSYRAIKEEESDNQKAMLRAIKEVLSPVSASALTTIAGLLALLFMSFTIGFDIGIVLMKSIVVSAITSLTLLPAFLLIFDGLMLKTAKKAVHVKSKIFCDIAIKWGKLIVPIASVIIIVCCVLNGLTSYDFVDSSNKNEEIGDNFGESGTLIVLYENTDDAAEKEEILMELLKSYKTADGKPVIKNHVAYSNTIGQVFDVEKASRDLGISKSDAELLFTIYCFTQDESAVRMDTGAFISLANDLIENDEDAKGFVSEDTAKMLDMILTLDLLMDGSYTADEFYAKMTSLEVMEGKELSEFAIDQMYGLYFFDGVTSKSVDFRTMVRFMTSSDYISDMLGEDTISALKGLLSEVNNLTHPDARFNYTQCMNLLSSYGVELNNYLKWALWYVDLGLDSNSTIGYLEFLEHLANNYSSQFPKDRISVIRNYRQIYAAVNSSYEYSGFIPALTSIASMAGKATDISVADSAVQQLYIMYFYDSNRLTAGKINGREFIEFIMETAANNETVAAQLPDGVSDMLRDVCALDDFLDGKELYDYKGMKSHISAFADGITSMDVSVGLTDAAVMGLYVKYATKNELIELGELSATELLKFVIDASENNELLKDRITDGMRNTIRESQENIERASSMLLGPNYSRMLLTVDLPAQSAESTRFVEYLSEQAKDIFGDNTYVAGEIATTVDLIKAFDDDSKLISIFTVISIFLIILVVFKSLSLPVILVAVIQGAVWISMSMSLLGSGSMFFMSYIMSMCILMGATIDYGILFSTNYVNNRQSLDKKESLYKALDAAMPTIFNSGIILMICGFIVGLVASQNSISSVGFLLFRGTLVSTVMITLVLPALVYLLDKFVVKLTYQGSHVALVKSVPSLIKEIPALVKKIPALIKRAPELIKKLAEWLKALPELFKGLVGKIKELIERLKNKTK